LEEIDMESFFIGLAVGIYIMGVLIALGFRVMGSERSVLSSFIWPLTFIMSGWEK